MGGRGGGARALAVTHGPPRGGGGRGGECAGLSLGGGQGAAVQEEGRPPHGLGGGQEEGRA
jgi:hypothetical protein